MRGGFRGGMRGGAIPLRNSHNDLKDINSIRFFSIPPIFNTFLIIFEEESSV
jgi:hypothetical protein